MLPEFNGDFIQWLRGFYYTATTGSMSAATQKMNRNQSAMTHQIRSLETEFGVKLFTGTKAHRVLTEEGKFLLMKTIQIFTIINDVKAQISALPSEVQGEVTLTAMYSAFSYYLPEAISRFSTLYPDVKFSIAGEIYQGDLYEKIHSRRADLGVVSADDIPDEFLAEPLFKSELALIIPAEYPVRSGAGITLEEIAQMPIIAPPKTSTLWQFLTRHFQRYGIKLQYKHTVDHQEAIKEYVSKGLGVSILDQFACVGEVMKNIRVFKISHFFPPRQYYLIRKRDTPFLYPHIKVFINFMHRWEQEKEDFNNAALGGLDQKSELPGAEVITGISPYSN